MKTTIDDIIAELISLDVEGPYWDFKEKWPDNNVDLLHDIICMANNLEDQDAFIIIGVSDSEKTGHLEVIGVSDQDRKNQQNLIDFLRGKKYAGDNRPITYVETLNISGKELDIIVIKKTHKTPYYLTVPYVCGNKRLLSGHIYIRVGDTNTPKDMTADIDKVEYLWRKRFGIDLTIRDKLLRLLDEPSGWVGSLDHKGILYHAIFPEFQIRLSEDDESRLQGNTIANNISDHFPDTHYYSNRIKIFFHTTCIFEEKVLFLDGARHLVPLPATKTVYLDQETNLNRSLTYVYFDKKTELGKLFLCLASEKGNWYGEKWHLAPGVAFLLFEDDNDRERFDEFVLVRLPELLVRYTKTLAENGLNNSVKMESYYQFGWSKANEIKARYLYNAYKGLENVALEKLIPKIN